MFVLSRWGNRNVTSLATQEKCFVAAMRSAFFCVSCAQAVVLELPELEQRLSNLQSQVERLWKKAEANVPPIEQRLAAMADQYAEYLKRWAATVERHTHAVAQLEAYASEWKGASTRVQQETSDRLHELETTIEREWDTLKRMQEEPIRELREQAESLSRVSLTMATASQQGVERAEARFAAFETEVHLRLNELTRELTSAVAEMKARVDRQAASRDPSTQWSLDDVTKLHGQLRDGGRGTGPPPHTIDSAPVSGPRELPAPSSVEAAERREPARVTLGSRPLHDAVRRHEGGIPIRWAVGLLGVVVLIAGVFGWRLQDQVKTAAVRARIAEVRSNTVVAEAARQAEVAREETAQQTAQARELVLQTQRVSAVMAAPDLIRFRLAGSDGASGQALVSRSQGLIVSGSRLAAAPPNRTLVAWLLTPTVPVRAGTLSESADGSVMLVEQTPAVPRRIVGVWVTAEASDSADAPSGAQVLSSVIAAAPAQPAADAQP
jgi:hypothetical protein